MITKNIIIEDIIQYIAIFLDDGKDLISWTFCCRKNYYCLKTRKESYKLWNNLCRLKIQKNIWFYTKEEENKFIFETSYALFCLFKKLIFNINTGKKYDKKEKHEGFYYYPLYTIIWNAEKNRCSYCYTKKKTKVEHDDIGFQCKWIFICSLCQENKYIRYGVHILKSLKKQNQNENNDDYVPNIKKKTKLLFFEEYKEKLFNLSKSKRFKSIEKNFIQDVSFFQIKTDENENQWRKNEKYWYLCFGQASYSLFTKIFLKDIRKKSV